jgi:hypothetical protein
MCQIKNSLREDPGDPSLKEMQPMESEVLICTELPLMAATLFGLLLDK